MFRWENLTPDTQTELVAAFAAWCDNGAGRNAGVHFAAFTAGVVAVLNMAAAANLRRSLNGG